MKSNHLYLLLAATLLMGCNYTRPPVEGKMDPYSPSQIHMDSEELSRDTRVGRPTVTRDDAGLLHITVPIRSQIDKTLYVDYYVTFFDKNGQPIADKMGPFTKVLQANTPDSVSINSTSPRASDFQVDFRYAR